MSGSRGNHESVFAVDRPTRSGRGSDLDLDFFLDDLFNFDRLDDSFAFYDDFLDGFDGDLHLHRDLFFDDHCLNDSFGAATSYRGHDRSGERSHYNQPQRGTHIA